MLPRREGKKVQYEVYVAPNVIAVVTVVPAGKASFV